MHHMNFLTVKTRSLLNYNERLFKEKKTEQIIHKDVTIGEKKEYE